MTTTHRPATETNAAGRRPDESIIAASLTEQHSRRLEARYRARLAGKHAPTGWTPHDTAQWPPLPARPRQIRHAPFSRLPMPAKLGEALDELDDVAAYAEEAEVETPSAIAFDNTRRLLKTMYHVAPRRYSVYPMPDGYIAIDARGRKGRIAVVMCGSDGGVLCLVSGDGEHRRARYSSAHNLPDAFIREALAEL